MGFLGSMPSDGLTQAFNAALGYLIPSKPNLCASFLRK